MAGPAPKDPALRRRSNEPARGEWVDLPPLARPVLPKLPARGRGAGRWSARSAAAWEAWRQDPVTSQWGASEIAQAVDLLYLHDAMVTGGGYGANEVRIRMDGLGLTPKGKRDLRYRVAAPAEVADLAQKREQRQTSSRERLRAVDPGGR